MQGRDAAASRAAQSSASHRRGTAPLPALPAGTLPALLVDRGGRILEANPAARALFRADERALLGEGLPSLLDAASASVLSAALHDGEPGAAVVEVTARRSDGTPFPGEATLLPDGLGERWLVLLRDITPRRDAERELRYEKALLESQNEASFDGILIVDADSRVVSMNHRFLEMWGVPDDLLQKGGMDEEALHSVLDRLEDPDEFLRKIEWLFEHPGEETRDEVRFKDGRVFERWSTPVHGAEGTYYGRGWYFRDITDRKRQETALKQALEKVQEHERFRTQLINNISHDLATPLTPIRIQLHLLENSLGGLNESQHRALGIVGRNLEQLRRLVDDLRDVARLQAGKLKLEKQPFDLNQLVSHALDSFREMAAARDTALRGALGPPASVLADPERVSQVLFNLLTNALKFTPEGGHIEVATSVHGQEVWVQVCDNGRGLSPEEMERLFKPFSQVHKPHEITERGTGLGLYISRGIAEQHDGRLWVESAGKGQGATFTLALPLAAAEDAARQAAPA